MQFDPNKKVPPDGKTSLAIRVSRENQNNQTNNIEVPNNQSISSTTTVHRDFHAPPSPVNKQVSTLAPASTVYGSGTMQPSQNNGSNPNDRPGTPPRPPYSPVTPVFAHLAPVQNPSMFHGALSHPIVPPATSPSPTSSAPPNGATASAMLPPMASALFAPEPASVPISESENPDAIALRSTISILQLQKEQGLRDIRKLERLKAAAAADPERFARELAAGNLTAKDPGGFVNFTHTDDDDEEEDDGLENSKERGMETIPTPQNVVRMPPINWSKYQIVGEPLDRMHEEQRQRPSLGEPRREEPTQRAQEHVLASPYRPLVDKLESPDKVKGVSKNKKT
ncbi:hypothetical protein BBP40_003037 [Aspergillus hancockii]|nr:hypothetical protein BBP40_003037 [Aspergillus hancockii]